MCKQGEHQQNILVLYNRPHKQSQHIMLAILILLTVITRPIYSFSSIHIHGTGQAVRPRDLSVFHHNRHARIKCNMCSVILNHI